MAAPIVVELAPNGSAAPEDLSRALIDTCSAAAGPGGCVLTTVPQVEARSERARVVVSFSGADAGVRVEVVTPIAAGEGPSREVTFREEDPQVERFRAAGLIVAGLVSQVSPREPEPEAPGLRPVAIEPRRRVLVRLEGQSGWNGARPWAGAALGADLSIAAPVFLALSGSYDQTWSRDAIGIAGQRTALGVGAGFAAALLPDHLEMRLRLAVDLEDLRASIHQTSTQREDDAGRTSTGLETGIDLVVPITTSLDVYAGGRADWWGGKTTVRVEGSPTEAFGAWRSSIAVGVNVRLQ